MAPRIKKCLIGKIYTDEINELNALGVETISLPVNSYLDDEICNHADILCFNADNETIFADSNIIGEIIPVLSQYKLISCELIKSPYPNDVKLNVALLGNKLICNKKTVSAIILKWAQSKNIQIINTNQGYT